MMGNGGVETESNRRGGERSRKNEREERRGKIRSGRAFPHFLLDNLSTDSYSS